MTTKTYGPYSARSPRRSYRYLDGIPEPVSYHRLRWVDYLCADCEERNDAARADVFHSLDRRLAATIRRYSVWLAAAPALRRSLDRLPPRLKPFYEICEIDATADLIARRLRHFERLWLGREDGPLPRHTLELNDDHPLAPFSPDRVPGTYKDVVARYVSSGGEHTLSTGSVFRADGDRVVVHWHSQRRLSFD